MEKHIGDLLEELGKLHPNNPTVEELKKKQFSNKTIREALRRDLIILPYDEDSSELGTSHRVSLNVKGFELFNQIRIKGAIEQLDDSIKRFNQSSDNASRTMLFLTIVILIMTVVQVGIALKFI